MTTNFQSTFTTLISISHTLGTRRLEFVEDIRRLSIFSQIIERKSQLGQSADDETRRISEILKTWENHRYILKHFVEASVAQFRRNQSRGAFTDKLEI